MNEPAAEQPSAPGAVHALGPVPILPAPLPGTGSLPAPFQVTGGDVPVLLAPLVPSVPPPKVLARARSASRWRMRLGIIAGIMALLCVGGVGIAFHEYDKATKPNRSAPDVVVDNYLRASLSDRDDKEAAQYVCNDPSGVLSFTMFRDEFVQREAQLGGQVAFDWGPLTVQGNHSDSSVSVDITVNTSGGNSLPGRSIHKWVFLAVNSSGWQVCGASQTT